MEALLFSCCLVQPVLQDCNDGISVTVHRTHVEDTGGYVRTGEVQVCEREGGEGGEDGGDGRDDRGKKGGL